MVGGNEAGNSGAEKRGRDRICSTNQLVSRPSQQRRSRTKAWLDAHEFGCPAWHTMAQSSTGWPKSRGWQRKRKMTVALSRQNWPQSRSHPTARKLHATSDQSHRCTRLWASEECTASRERSAQRHATHSRARLSVAQSSFAHSTPHSSCVSSLRTECSRSCYLCSATCFRSSSAPTMSVAPLPPDADAPLSRIPPQSLLCLCLGNICRSPLAEGIVRREIEQRGLKGWVRTHTRGAQSTYEWRARAG